MEYPHENFEQGNAPDASRETKNESAPKIQFLPRFEEFKGGEVDDEGKYAEPSPERKAEIERRLDQLGDIMDGASFDYHLDGAINISLIQDRFIRDHKDVDMSVADADLGALEEQLKKKGYVIVYADRNRYTETQRCLEVVSAAEVQKRKLYELQLARVDANGKIQEDFGELNFIDLHVPHRDAEGNIFIENSGVTLPAKYFEKNKTHQTPGGHEIPVSHPVVVAYHKVESGRDYDFQDIAHLKDQLSQEDVAFLVETFEHEPERKLEQYVPMMEKIFARVNPEMTTEEVSSQLEKTGIGKDPEGKAFIAEFPGLLKADPKMNKETFVALFMDRMHVKDKLDARAKEKVERLKKALA